MGTAKTGELNIKLILRRGVVNRYKLTRRYILQSDEFKARHIQPRIGRAAMSEIPDEAGAGNVLSIRDLQAVLFNPCTNFPGKVIKDLAFSDALRCANTKSDDIVFADCELVFVSITVMIIEFRGRLHTNALLTIIRIRQKKRLNFSVHPVLQKSIFKRLKAKMRAAETVMQLAILIAIKRRWF